MGFQRAGRGRRARQAGETGQHLVKAVVLYLLDPVGGSDLVPRLPAFQPVLCSAFPGIPLLTLQNLPLLYCTWKRPYGGPEAPSLTLHLSDPWRFLLAGLFPTAGVVCAGPSVWGPPSPSPHSALHFMYVLFPKHMLFLFRNI